MLKSLDRFYEIMSFTLILNKVIYRHLDLTETTETAETTETTEIRNTAISNI